MTKRDVQIKHCEEVLNSKVAELRKTLLKATAEEKASLQKQIKEAKNETAK